MSSMSYGVSWCRFAAVLRALQWSGGRRWRRLRRRCRQRFVCACAALPLNTQHPLYRRRAPCAGLLLKQMGYTVTAIKIDPYLNGTLSVPQRAARGVVCGARWWLAPVCVCYPPHTHKLRALICGAVWHPLRAVFRLIDSFFACNSWAFVIAHAFCRFVGDFVRLPHPFSSATTLLAPRHRRIAVAAHLARAVAPWCCVCLQWTLAR